MSVNFLLATTKMGVKPVVPVLGMGATLFVGSDRYPYHVTKVISPKAVELSAAKYKRTDNNGLSESQTYEITPATFDSKAVIVTMRKNGRWIQKGQGLKNGSCFLLGEADAYQDPSF